MDEGAGLAGLGVLGRFDFDLAVEGELVRHIAAFDDRLFGQRLPGRLTADGLGALRAECQPCQRYGDDEQHHQVADGKDDTAEDMHGEHLGDRLRCARGRAARARV